MVEPIAQPLPTGLVTGRCADAVATSGTIAKADYTGATPAAPTTVTIGETSVTLTAITGYEYSLGGSVWQAGASFTGLTGGTNYDFYQRVAATDTISAAKVAFSNAGSYAVWISFRSVMPSPSVSTAASASDTSSTELTPNRAINTSCSVSSAGSLSRPGGLR